MMPLLDKFSHAATVTKWKADQQMRLLKIQNQINEIEQSIRGEKSKLAETAIHLFAQENLLNDELLEICTRINQFRDQITEKQRYQEAIRQERPPEYAEYTPTVSETKTGLVCPECGRELVGKFCPDHGLEGVRKVTTQETEVEVITPKEGGQLVCPICRKVLNVRFCPNHGVEGVPAGQI